MADPGPLCHVKNVPIEAAHQVMACSELVWTFGGRIGGWRKPHLLLAMRHFQLPMTPSPFQTAREYERQLWQVFLNHLHTSRSHRVYVLYRLDTRQAGWVCLVPDTHEGEVARVLSDLHLQVETALPAELLQ